jgi:hypothetical protein
MLGKCHMDKKSTKDERQVKDVLCSLFFKIECLLELLVQITNNYHGCASHTRPLELEPMLLGFYKLFSLLPKLVLHTSTPPSLLVYLYYNFCVLAHRFLIYLYSVFCVLIVHLLCTCTQSFVYLCFIFSVPVNLYSVLLFFLALRICTWFYTISFHLTRYFRMSSPHAIDGSTLAASSSPAGCTI